MALRLHKPSHDPKRRVELTSACVEINQCDGCIILGDDGRPGSVER